MLLVSIDTLRADHLAAYGYGRETSPALTRLAAEGARFANAYAQASATVPTHASLFTGRLPFEHGSFHVGLPIAAEEHTLAEAFASLGYRTFSIASSVRFRGRTGFDQGFEQYEVFEQAPESERSRIVTDRALEQIVAADERPWMGFLHYFDPHQPYAPPPRYRTIWHPGREHPAPEKTSDYVYFHDDPARDVPPDVLAWLTNLYDGEIRFLDAQLERLFRAVRRVRGRPVLVVVTSDHGEEFREHGGLSHARRLHEELLRVPLFFWWPSRIRAGLVVSTPASSVDVMPTLLELAGAPTASSSGRSLAPELLGREPTGDPRAILLAQVGPERWAVSANLDGQRYKLVETADGTRLYDLGNDPGGYEDLAAAMPERVAALRRIATELGLDDQASARTPEPVPDAVRDRLRAIGYMDEAGAATAAPAPGRPGT